MGRRLEVSQELGLTAECQAVGTEGPEGAGAAVPGWGSIAYEREHLKWRVSQAEIKPSGSNKRFSV